MELRAEPNWERAGVALIAHKRLCDAGHTVTETDVPGLFDIAGIASDVTIGQMIDIASKLPPPNPA